MRRTLTIAGFALTFTILAASLQEAQASRQQAPIQQQALSFLANPTRVDAYRAGAISASTSERLKRQTLTTLSPVLAARLSHLLSTTSSFSNRVAKCSQCDVVYRFWKGSRYVQVGVYFHCAGLSLSDETGVSFGQPGFVPSYTKLVQVTKAVFPQDKALQRLTKIPPRPPLER